MGQRRVQMEWPYREGHATVHIQSVLYIQFDDLNSYGQSKTATPQNKTLPLAQSEVKPGNGEY